MKGVALKQLTKYIIYTGSALPGECPTLIDCTKIDDPYVSIYGPECEEEKKKV